eukprot:gb/GECG01003074.1/.p1 GENE.gb/GECG01003074.1/~~gb/GECG01003074.1/.p1  ORF type:complete len:868 (+),score=91.16 gb/GECG01003074.1/:1-2604(+)
MAAAASGGALEASSSQDQLQPEQGDAVASWCRCVGLVEFDAEKGPTLSYEYPSGVIHSECRTTLAHLCLPEGMSAGPDGVLECVYCIRLRNSPKQWTPSACFKIPGRERASSVLRSLQKSSHEEEGAASGQSRSEFLLGAVYFSQKPNTSHRRGFDQTGIILLSELPFPVLLKHAALVIGHAYEDTKALVTLEMAYRHIRDWPSPTEGEAVQLPLLGRTLEYTIPRRGNLEASHPQNKDATGATIGQDNFSDVGVYRTLCPFLHYLWHIWTLLIRGKTVCVRCPDATLCSDIVLAIVSLINPLPFSGDYRPYITIHDPDTWNMSRYLRKENDGGEEMSGLSARGKAFRLLSPKHTYKARTPSPSQKSDASSSSPMSRLTLTPPRRPLASNSDAKRSKNTLSKLRNLWKGKRGSSKWSADSSLKDSPTELFLESREFPETTQGREIGLVTGFSNPLLWQHLGNADAGLNVDVKPCMGTSSSGDARVRRCRSSDEALSAEDQNCSPGNDTELRDRAPTVSCFSSEPIKCTANVKASKSAREYRYHNCRNIAVPLGTPLDNSLKGMEYKKSNSSKSTFLHKDGWNVPPSKTVLKQLLPVNNGLEEGEQLRLNTASENKGKGSAAAERSLTYDHSEGEIPAVIINDSILSKHFRDLTVGFLRPFETYFELCMEQVSVTSTHSSKGALGAMNLGPYDDFASCLLRPFCVETFLEHLDKKDLPKQVKKVDFKRLYRDFMQTSTFMVWFRQRRREAEDTVFSLTRTLRMSLSPDILYEQLNQQSEDDLSGNGDLSSSSASLTLLRKIFARISDERSYLCKDSALYEQIKRHLAVVYSLASQESNEEVRCLSIARETSGMFDDSDVIAHTDPAES